jgi:selenide,water dikinase
VALGNSEWFKLLADPQTSGGLLIAVDPLSKQTFETILNENQIEPHLIGQMRTKDSVNERLVLTIM